MKFYSKILGDRDYSLFEVAHFGLRLPHTLSSFGETVSANVSNWCTLKSGFHVRTSGRHERITNCSKLELFNFRDFLQHSPGFTESNLRGLSFYAFWRLFDVRNGRIFKRHREAIVAVTGNGLPTRANAKNPQHAQYARLTLYAYMPCADLRGTDYIDDCVRIYFKQDWPAALKAFVSDVDNLWCPKWLRRNYEVQNKTDVLDETDAVAPVDAADLRCQLCELPDKTEVAEPSRARFPHADKLASNFEFEEEEPDGVEDTERPQPCCPTQWSKEHREAWQLHSGLGPNLHCETRANSPEPLPEVVNPPNHKWSTFHSHFKAFAPDVFWEKLRNSSTTYSDESLTVDALGDDYQQLFVRLVLDHCKGVLLSLIHI